MHYLHQVRLDRAHENLAQAHGSVADIAYNWGLHQPQPLRPHLTGSTIERSARASSPNVTMTMRAMIHQALP
jgi:AraC-like DNA-binding protein